MADRPPLSTSAAKLLPLLCALPEEAQCALLALLRWQESAAAAALPTVAEREAQRNVDVVEVAPAQVVEALVQRVEALERELAELRDSVSYTGPPLLTKKAFLRQHPDLYSKSGLDKVLFLREENGLGDFGAIHQRAKGCRVLIDPKKFLEWYRWYHARG